MQEYNRIEDTEYISDAPTQLNKNMESIATDFSGASFPTENLFVGMKCLRTDENKIYRLYENASNKLVWQPEYTIVDGGIEVKEANHAIQADSLIVEDLGSFTNQTVSDLQTAIKNWFAKHPTKYRVAKFTAHKQFVGFWNDNLSTPIPGGITWTITTISTYNSISYGAFLISTTTQGDNYIIHLTDGNFSNLYKLFTASDIATQSEAEAGTDNTKVMTPKGVDYRLNKDRALKTFASLSQIGTFTSTSTLADVAKAMPQNSCLSVVLDKNDYPNMVPVEETNIALIAVRQTSVTSFIGKGTNKAKTFIGHYFTWETTFSGWKQLAITDDFAPTKSQRNGYYRGKNLGTIASVADADAFNTAHGLSAGTFNDIFVGDEITIKDGTYNAVWLVAGIDWDYNKGDTASGHGILLIPKTPLYNDQMNSTNVTTGGYKGSAMHTTKLPALVTKLQTVLGSHLKKRRVLLSNSVHTSIASMAGADWTGASNGWEWTDAYAVLPSEVEVYGSTVLSSSLYDVGEACQKLPIFNFINPVYFSRWYFWMRAVASSTTFCHVYADGHATNNGASHPNGVRPLIYLA